MNDSAKIFSYIILLAICFPFMIKANEYKPINSMENISIIKDSQLDLSLRNRFKYMNENEVGPTYIHTAWAQTIGLDYRSGLWMDILGFDVSYVDVTRLAASDYFASRDLLWNNGSEFKSSNAKGYSKFNQRYIKMHLRYDENLSYDIKYGWQSPTELAVLKSTYESAKNSYLGYSGIIKYKEISFESLYFNRGIERMSPHEEKFLTRDRKVVDYIAAGGLNYKGKNLKGSYNYGYARDYIERHVLELSYSPYSDIKIGTQIYGNIPLDMYRDMPQSRQAANGNAWHYAADIRIQQEALGLKFGLGYTDASKSDGSLGYFDRHPVRNARWRLNPMSSAAYHYQRDGEVAVTGLIDYQYEKNLYSALQLNYGQFNYKNNTFKTGEINIINAWKFDDSKLKDFTIFTKLTKAWLYKTKGDRAQPEFDHSGRYERGNTIAADIIFDYKFNIF